MKLRLRVNVRYHVYPSRKYEEPGQMVHKDEPVLEFLDENGDWQVVPVVEVEDPRYPKWRNK